MVQDLHFRILKFPLMIGGKPLQILDSTCPPEVWGMLMVSRGQLSMFDRCFCDFDGPNCCIETCFGFSRWKKLSWLELDGRIFWQCGMDLTECLRGRKHMESMVNLQARIAGKVFADLHLASYQRVQGPGEDSCNEIARARARETPIVMAREIVQGLCGDELRWNSLSVFSMKLS